MRHGFYSCKTSVNNSNAYAILSRMKMFRSHEGGYTIIEVMIVLSVTAFLAIGAVTAISTRQRRTEFTTSFREIEARIRDVINDAATGYYANAANFTCTAGTGATDKPIFATNATNTQGENDSCVFLGRAIQFSVAGSSGSQYAIYDLAGRREVVASSIKRLAENYHSESQITAISRKTADAASYPTTTQLATLPGGMKVFSAKYVVGTDTTNFPAIASQISTIGFVLNLPNYTDGVLENKGQHTNLLVFVNSRPDKTALEAADTIDATDNSGTMYLNPDGYVEIKFSSGTTDQCGVVIIGGQGRETVVTSQILEGVCT